MEAVSPILKRRMHSSATLKASAVLALLFGSTPPELPSPKACGMTHLKLEDFKGRSREVEKQRR